MSDTLIRDNKNYGSVGEFLKDVVKEGSELSVVSAYFTIFAYYCSINYIYCQNTLL